ncbi:hypothetical protein [Burkholderia ubonensis]|uniref:hypothetical protein n=2 Tax=Burkholderia ubonensis TaxID=101571 RepID=UPI0012F71FCA|nr:hypothetical protein [Burkholderia ubonensis]
MEEEMRLNRLRVPSCFIGNCIKLIIAISISSYSNSSFAWAAGSVTDCKWTSGENNITLDFKVSLFNTSSDEDIRGSKALIVYRYNKNGKVMPVKLATTTAIETKYRTPGRIHEDYYGTAFYDISGDDVAWRISQFTEVVGYQVVVSKDEIREWRAIGVQMGRYHYDGYVLSRRDMVYMTEENTGGAGVCKKFIDEKVPPPPPPISIDVNAPDWNLGELERGENIKKFSSVTEQLCFTYTGTAVSGKSFIINASNVNGIASNTYRLRNLNDSSQLVPYSVTLDSGSSTVSLPNMSNAALSLDSSGKTCFMPTFKASVGSSVKEGDYSDVLTFTVVTKS